MAFNRHGVGWDKIKVTLNIVNKEKRITEDEVGVQVSNIMEGFGNSRTASDIT
jgi:hypothetical protein